jgi:hypothetical protein
MGGMPDQRLESHPYGFGVCRCMTHRARLLKQVFVNVESLLHTDDLAISFHPGQPDESGSILTRTCQTERARGLLPIEDPGAGPPLRRAIQEQFGLKLEPTRGPANYLIIDAVDRPTEN